MTFWLWGSLIAAVILAVIQRPIINWDMRRIQAKKARQQPALMTAQQIDTLEREVGVGPYAPWADKPVPAPEPPPVVAEVVLAPPASVVQFNSAFTDYYSQPLKVPVYAPGRFYSQKSAEMIIRTLEGQGIEYDLVRDDFGDIIRINNRKGDWARG